MSKKDKKSKVKKRIVGIAFLLIKPFIVPLLLVAIILILVSTITDILYLIFNNDGSVDITKELAYYDIKFDMDIDLEDVKNFFVSVWEFADEYLGLGMSADADWPVERTL